MGHAEDRLQFVIGSARAPSPTNRHGAPRRDSPRPAATAPMDRRQTVPGIPGEGSPKTGSTSCPAAIPDAASRGHERYGSPGKHR
jgi:hypothetical protein